MIIIPAIDLKDHQVVRLSQGRMGEAKVYSDDPVAVAKKWVDAGAKRIHIVDLNGAFEGKPIHFDEIQKIARAFPQIEIEVGGGIRTVEVADRYFKSGVSFCIFGTAAIKDPDEVKAACKKYPGKIILGLDAKNGQVAVEGWGEESGSGAVELAKKFAKKGIAAIIYTDIAKDGMMSGPNLPEMRSMAAQSSVPIIASGGVSILPDIEKLKQIPRIFGAIVGQAIYEGRIDLKEAIAVAANPPNPPFSKGGN
ncbi:MAG: 1-(5-phosphoribosyl)-5-[(5-phosphoribosylamino)methylideneamino]imidazole-4-carboxamide isomerase [Deltaproteobacteria bacterium]|nr:1-(5-phosphoribosyl)-5-[(5-phosphoribosylamino)methylideneamino]imidazole-4-carboxamide isomerase [Deltaproteobacteria bacterium]